MTNTRFDMSKLIAALCSVLSVNPLIERQFSSSIAESFDIRCMPAPLWLESILFTLEIGLGYGNSSLIAPGADELKFLVDSNPLLNKLRKFP